MYKTTATHADVTMSFQCAVCDACGPLHGQDDPAARSHAEHTGHKVRVGRLLQWSLVPDTRTYAGVSR